MKPAWTKPAFEESAVGAECTAYAGAWRVGVASEVSKPGQPGGASISEPVGGRAAPDGSARSGSGPAA